MKTIYKYIEPTDYWRTRFREAHCAICKKLQVGYHWYLYVEASSQETLVDEWCKVCLSCSEVLELAPLMWESISMETIEDRFRYGNGEFFRRANKENFEVVFTRP